MTRLIYGLALSLIFALSGSAQTLSPAKPGNKVATINGQPVYEQDLAPDLVSKLLQLHNQEYQLKSKALDDLIQKRVVEVEARKRGVSPDRLLEEEVDSRVPEPTEAEIRGYYLAVRNEINRPFDEVRPQLQKAVKLLAIAEARQDYAKRLRAKNDVVVLLSPPKVDVASDPARVRGNPNAPVTIVEFSDFQCPYCRKAQAILKDLLARYGGRVKLSYRDFPMRSLHPQAEIAAEGGRCAEEQGRFWEYYDALFDSPATLDEAGLEATAQKLGLNEKEFHSCLTSGKFKAEIERDVMEGTRAGVAGTPGFFINGEFVNGAQPEADFVRIIDRELDHSGSGNPARVSR